jgi:hypothetical protein
MPWQHAVGEPRGSRIAVAVGRDKEGRFGAMFKRLAGFAPPDQLLADLAATMVDPGTQDLNNPTIPAGFTFLGQFLDHDMTLDKTPLDLQQRDPHALTDFRTARFDLDSVYDGGPANRPELYEPAQPAKLKITGLGDPNVPDDLPRQPDGKALIGDGRNDENLIVCQVHVAIMKFHNAIVDHLQAQGVGGADLFPRAQNLTRWYYQWVIVHDFLPHVVGQPMVDELVTERGRGQRPNVHLRFYKPKNPNRPFMPIEFSVAAYRFGHSMVRPGYKVSETAGGPIFADPQSDDDLHGSRPIPDKFAIAFHNFFDIPGIPGPPVNDSRRMDTRLAQGLFHLPTPQVVASPPDPPPLIVSLAQRNLLRGRMLGLPSAQDVAREMGLTPLSNTDLGLSDESGWGGKAPLWFYILKEAELQHDGKRLGDVGGRIIAETFLGLLDADHSSYLHARPDAFEPAPPIAPAPGQFLIGDLLRFAGAA